MTRVLLIGIAPEAVDISDPSLPPDLTQEKIAKGIEITLEDMRRRGWEAGFCAVTPDGAEAMLAESLKPGWDCAVVGGGIRIPPKNLLVFERIINAILREAPGTAIAFNTQPENSADAAQRWLPAS